MTLMTRIEESQNEVEKQNLLAVETARQQLIHAGYEILSTTFRSDAEGWKVEAKSKAEVPFHIVVRSDEDVENILLQTQTSVSDTGDRRAVGMNEQQPA